MGRRWLGAPMGNIYVCFLPSLTCPGCVTAPDATVFGKKKKPANPGLAADNRETLGTTGTLPRFQKFIKNDNRKRQILQFLCVLLSTCPITSQTLLGGYNQGKQRWFLGPRFPRQAYKKDKPKLTF